MKAPKVTFIDDGINSIFLPKRQLFESFCIENGVVREETPTTQISHGTVCHQVFHEHVKSSYRLTSIRILESESLTGNIKNLTTALNWCIENDVDLINMSIGSRRYNDLLSLYGTVERAADAGVTIVAACNNENTITFPACFPKVIGVRHCYDAKLKDNFHYNDQAYDQIEAFVCAEDKVLQLKRHKSMCFSASNSLAAPVISARVCDYMFDGVFGIDDVKQKLSKDSIYMCTDFGFYKGLFTNWKPIDIPIIIFGRDKPFDLMCKSISIFTKLGYYAVGLTISKKTDIMRSIYNLYNFHVSAFEMIELYSNLLQPDIVIIDCEDANIEDFSSFSDIVVSGQHASNNKQNMPFCIDVDYNADKLVEKILTHFSVDE